MSDFELRLAKGKVVWVAALHAEVTYAHAYEGIPTASTNDGYLAGFGREVERIFHGPYPCHVIPPERRAGQDVAMNGERREMLPRWWVAANCFGDGMSTCLAIIWFQDELVPIVSDPVRERLAALDWDRHALEFEP